MKVNLPDRDKCLSRTNMHYYSLDNYTQMNMVIRLLIVFDFKVLTVFEFQT